MPLESPSPRNASPPPNDPHNNALFLEPLMGTPLTIYIEKDVDDRDDLVDLIAVSVLHLPHRSSGPIAGLTETRRRRLSHSQQHSIHFRQVSIDPPNSPTLIHISVGPHKESGQNLFRQYTSESGKIVLHSRWVHECIRAGSLQTFQNNWAGCKVTGTEK